MTFSYKLYFSQRDPPLGYIYKHLFINICLGYKILKTDFKNERPTFLRISLTNIYTCENPKEKLLWIQ